MCWNTTLRVSFKRRKHTKRALRSFSTTSGVAQLAKSSGRGLISRAVQRDVIMEVLPVSLHLFMTLTGGEQNTR
uniref:Bestrophin homolog n=1 Tax=Parascaris univalens TaxID=6257 RepID=A0A915AIW6_PARUN